MPLKNDFEKLPALLDVWLIRISEEDVKNNMLINIKAIETLSNITLDLLNQELTDVSEFQVKSEVKKNQKVEKKK